LTIFAAATQFQRHALRAASAVLNLVAADAWRRKVPTTTRATPWRSPARDTLPLGRAEAEASLARVEALAKVMDSIVAIPGTNVRIGVDALLGIVPVIGDVISQAISSYIIWEARRIGASRFTVARMIGNSLLDMTVGAIPVVGDAFDVAFRANVRNLTLLKAELERKGIRSKSIDL
jgi:hypothetical protein